MANEGALSIERTHLAGAVEDVGGTPTRLKADETSGSLRVNLWVWDADTLAWVRMTQPLIDLGNLEALLATTYWKDQRYEYSGGNLVYKGLATTHKAATDTGDLWHVWKYTYVDGDCTRIEGPIVCNWDDRATEAWA